MEYRSGLTRVLGSSRWLVAASAVAVCLFAASPAHANLVANGSFETGVGAPSSGFSTLGAVNTDITGWTLTNGTIDWINDYWVASDGSYSLDMDGVTPGTIQTSAPLSTVIGQAYRLSFDMAGNPDGSPQFKQLDVQVGGFAPQSFLLSSSASTPWKHGVDDVYVRLHGELHLDEPDVHERRRKRVRRLRSRPRQRRRGSRARARHPSAAGRWPVGPWYREAPQGVASRLF